MKEVGKKCKCMKKCSCDIDVQPLSQVTQVGKEMNGVKQQIEQLNTRVNYYQKNMDATFEAGKKAQETAEYVDEVFHTAIEQNGNVEVVDARGGLPSLGVRLDSVSEQLEDKEKKINNLYSVVDKSINKTRFIAHRGWFWAPENTIASLELASKQGLYGVEADVRLTSDGHFVIMHDETVDRTTNGTGRVDSLTLAQIKELTIDSGQNITYYPNLKVPTLEEWLLACKNNNLIFMCDSQTIGNNIDLFIELLRKYDMEKSTIVASTMSVLNLIRERSSLIELYMISFEVLSNTLIDTAFDNGFNLSYYSSNGTIDTTYLESVKYAHSKGVKLAGFTENIPSRVKQLQNVGVDYIITDVVEDTPQLSNDFKPKIYKSINTKTDFIGSMSTTINVEYNNIPVSNGFYFNNSENIIYFFSPSGTQGFACVKNIGSMRKGDVIEMFANVTVTSGTVTTAYDTDALSGREPFEYGIGEHLIYRKFVVPHDTTTFKPILGIGTSQNGEFSIKDGIIFKITSSRSAGNVTTTQLKATLVSDSGATEQRFSLYTGDSCTITKANANGIYVTFDKSLENTGVAVASGGVGADMYTIKTAYTTNNRVYLAFVNTMTGVEVGINTLPSTMYVSVIMM